MRVSPGVLLFLLSSSFVAGIAIIDLPTSDDNNIIPVDYDLMNDLGNQELVYSYEDQNDEDSIETVSDSSSSNRRNE